MTIIALMMNDVETARAARDKVANMSRDDIVCLQDAVVAYKDQNGDVKLDQSVNHAATGAISGTFWGMLLGVMFGVFTGTPYAALTGAVFGATGGTLSGALSEFGVSDLIVQETSAVIEEGKAMLFLLGRTGAPEKLLKHLEPFGGAVVS